MATFLDIAGQRFGKLVVLARSQNDKNGATRWLVICDCGRSCKAPVRSNSLRTGNTKACGTCRKIGDARATKHGLSVGPEKYLYRLWYNIKRRTSDKKSSDYPRYGGCGVGMHGPWFDDPIGFVAWVKSNLGPRPLGYSMDRINPWLGYDPGNLRWADTTTQARNQKRTHAYADLLVAKRRIIELEAIVASLASKQN